MPDPIFADRLSRLRARMQETATDLVAIGPSSHLRWLAGLNPHGDERPVMLLVGPRGEGMLMPALNADSQRPLTDFAFFNWADADGPQDALDALLVHIGATGPGLSVAVDETMRADFALLLLDNLKSPRRSFTWETVGRLRASKDDAEYRLLKANALIDDKAMTYAFDSLVEGISELELAEKIEKFFQSQGATKEFIIVGFGGNGAFPHHHNSERRLKKNDAVLVDIGGRSNGYPSDMTRVGWFGTPSEEFRKVHGIVNAAVEAAIKAAVAGAPAKSVDDAARGTIAAAGYGERFLHRTGHGLGIDVHEPPYITATSHLPLEEGNCFSIEPGVYLSGQFGLRLEEIVVIRNGKAEVLSELTRDIFVRG